MIRIAKAGRFGKIKKRLEVEMEGFDDGFKSDIDYKGFAETSVTLFETVSLWDGLQKSKKVLISKKKSRKIADWGATYSRKVLIS